MNRFFLGVKKRAINALIQDYGDTLDTLTTLDRSAFGGVYLSLFYRWLPLHFGRFLELLESQHYSISTVFQQWNSILLLKDPVTESTCNKFRDAFLCPDSRSKTLQRKSEG